jgi:hypothetical protein
VVLLLIDEASVPLLDRDSHIGGEADLRLGLQRFRVTTYNRLILSAEEGTFNDRDPYRLRALCHPSLRSLTWHIQLVLSAEEGTFSRIDPYPLCALGRRWLRSLECGIDRHAEVRALRQK